MRIGIDFDNTLADYDGVFGPVALSLGLLDGSAAGTKNDLRDAIRGRDSGEEDWQRLQGQVYGRYMDRARLMEGAAEFLSACRDKGGNVFIVSHKTEFGHHDPDRVNLRDAAMAWMAAQHFFEGDGFAIPEDHVYFEPTREEKIARITSLDCTHFVDDLEEVFLDAAFPSGVKGYLYGRPATPGDAPVHAVSHWNEITEALFDA